MATHAKTYRVWFVRPKNGLPFIGDTHAQGWQIMAWRTRREANAFRAICGFETHPPVRATLELTP